MFLALVLSVMAVGSASANDGDRRPAGVSFGLGGNNGGGGGGYGGCGGCCP